MSAVVLALLTWALLNPPPLQREVEAPAEPQQASGVEAALTSEVSAPVQAFLAFANGNPGREVPAIGQGHEYTAEGILRLVAALRTLIPESDEAALRQLIDLRMDADTLRRDRSSLEHADIVRHAFTSVADLLARATGHDVSELGRAARAIDPDRRLLRQQAQVRHFFAVAAQTLRRSTPPSRVGVHREATSMR
jgi:hypothetical protein